ALDLGSTPPPLQPLPPPLSPSSSLAMASIFSGLSPLSTGTKVTIDMPPPSAPLFTESITTLVACSHST
ncbi:hypothetical protein KI387_041143, partial [Taxus chinensis]